MAFKFQCHIIFVLFYISTVLVSLIAPTQGDDGLVHNVPQVLHDAGYTFMSRTIQSTLPTLLPGQDSNNGAVTIFCPSDEAFFEADIGQPPLQLLQYHVVPRKLEREDLETSIPFGSKLDTLLQGHPLVVTTLGHVNASINNVRVEAWDVYNDGHVIVHGVHRFFDPSFQTAEFPWFNESPISNSTSSRSASKRDNTYSVTNWKRTLEVILVAALVVICAMLVKFLIQKFRVSKVGVVVDGTDQKASHSNSKCQDPKVVSIVRLEEIVISKV